MWIGIGIAVVLAVVIAVLMGNRKSPEQVMQQEDGADQVKRWARGCYAMVYGNADPGRKGKRGCLGTLSEYWEITTPEQVQETVKDLQGLPENDAAWDLMRAIIVARFAAGAELISGEQSWAVIGAVRPRLQQAFGSWQELASAYGRAREAAGFGSDMLTDARPEAEKIWGLVPFK
jgi:hypothetical protein